MECRARKRENKRKVGLIEEKQRKNLNDIELVMDGFKE